MNTNQIEQLITNFNKPRTYLLVGNVLLAFFLILFSNLKVLPLDFGDLVFFSLLALALALYRPGWAFLIFVGLIPLENINLAPMQFGLTVRPYQLLGALLIIAVLVRLFTKRLNFKLAKFNLADYLVLVLVVAGFISALVGTNNYLPLRMAAIFASFAALYFLTRNFIQNTNDLKKIIPFFLSSSAVVALYGIWQNWAYLHGRHFFEVMLGRPNGTFTEPDWLGVFLVLLVGVIYALIYSVSKFDNSKLIRNSKFKIQNLFSFALYLTLVISYTLMIITVSRSAWLAAALATLMFLFIVLTNLRFRNWQWKNATFSGLKILASLAVALGVIYIFHLTDFQLGNRIQSTGTGLQQITIACGQKINLPAKIQTDADLAPYDCRQINLQDIAADRAAGKYVTTVYRNDPNVATRSLIYQKSWNEIKAHPILGIGWGSISDILGKDARGVPLNSSNIFLETWLGAGVLGFLALVAILFYVLFNAVKNYFYAGNDLQKSINLFIIVSWFGLVVANLFNAGIFLGFFWVWLAVSQISN